MLLTPLLETCFAREDPRQEVDEPCQRVEQSGSNKLKAPPFGYRLHNSLRRRLIRIYATAANFSN